jgi:hypothetical protein
LKIKSPYHYRARKAAAIRFGDPAAAAEADLGLRASKIAKTIKVECAGPPLPSEVIDELRNLLPPTGEVAGR